MFWRTTNSCNYFVSSDISYSMSLKLLPSPAKRKERKGKKSSLPYPNHIMVVHVIISTNLCSLCSIVCRNLMSMGLSGSISPSISRLTALSGMYVNIKFLSADRFTAANKFLNSLIYHRWLGNNSLTGSIPDLSSLSNLEIL